MAERCGAASPDRPFVHLAAFSAGGGRESGQSDYGAICSQNRKFGEKWIFAAHVRNGVLSRVDYRATTRNEHP
jgi:hypothetical protein